MRRTGTIAASYFDGLYAADPDPWRFRTSDYERDKYDATLAALSRPHYRSALEVGCSIGVFTRHLAGRCDRLVAVDASAVALEAACRECADLAGVVFERRMIPGEWPDASYDLVVLSEVLYYLVRTDVQATAERCRSVLHRGGELILCHWLGETDYPLSGHAAADTFIDTFAPADVHVRTILQPMFRLDQITARNAVQDPALLIQS